MASGLVILDRDGVINHDSSEFVKSPAEWRPIDGSVAAIASLSRAGFTIAVATNQSGIGRRLLDPPSLDSIHEKMRQMVSEAGGHIDRVVYCPHLPDDGCDCRKPAPGLLEQLSRHYGVSLNGVPVVGDSARDIEAAIAVNARPMLVMTGNGEKTAERFRKNEVQVETYPNLAAAAERLIDETLDGAG